MPYSSHVRAEAKRLFVNQDYTFAQIERALAPDGPVAQTINNWAQQADGNGKTWHDLRDERRERLFRETSPEQMAAKLMQRMDTALDKPGTKGADELAKYAAVFQDIVDPRYQLSMVFQVLTDFVQFCQDEHPDLIAEGDLTDAARRFKDRERERLYS
jgi:uncharacterized protein Usg